MVRVFSIRSVAGRGLQVTAHGIRHDAEESPPAKAGCTRAVLRVIARAGRPLTARQVTARCRRRGPWAWASVWVALQRLATKGRLVQLAGRPVRFAPA